MKAHHIVLIVSLAALCWVWLHRAATPQSMEYRLGFGDARGGSVSVDVELVPASGAPVVLRGMLADGILGVSGLKAFDPSGAELGIRFDSASVTDEEGDLVRFTTATLDPGASPVVHLRYDVRPGVYLPPAGDNELRRCGTVSQHGCALSLANFALLPVEVPTALHLEADLPAGWRTVRPLPRTVPSTDREALREATLVAGAYAPAPAELAPGVHARLGAPGAPGAPGATGTEESAELLDALRAVVRAMEDMLGPPREPIELVVLPVEHAREPHAMDAAAGPRTKDPAPPAELPATSPVVAVDLRGVDPGSLRRLVHRLVPAWWARDPVDLELASSPDAWFAVGLREYLAHVLPSRVGLVDRDPVIAIENSWVCQPELRGIDLRLPTDAARSSQYARRLVSMALLHELDMVLPDGLVPHLRGYGGHGVPASLAEGSSAAIFRDWLHTRIERGQRQLLFEPDWRLPWDPAPMQEEGARIARSLSFAFSADTAGLLETCGCKAGQSGGVARRASAVNEWRRTDPGLVLIDLGSFSALAKAEAFVDASLAEEQDLYPELMSLLGYDAVVLGPDELYSGFVRRPSGARVVPGTSAPRGAASGGVRSAAWTGGGPAWLGAGIEVAGRPLGAPFAIVEREGLRIGVVGHTELLENAHARQAQEARMTGVRFPTTPDVDLLRELRAEVDLLVVAGRMRPATLRALAAPELGVDLVLGANHPVSFEAGASGFLGRTAVVLDQMAFVGIQRVDLFLSPDGRVVSARTSARKLDTDVPEDAAVRARLDAFYSSSVVANLDVEPVFDGDPWHRIPYVGSRKCGSCHAEQYTSWQATAHATAMATLRNGRRDRNPGCVKCHVVGLGSDSGYSVARPDPDLGAVGCENCHGAGRAHAEHPTKENIRLTPDRPTCVRCHDTEHSEAFEERFSEAWQRVLHR